MHRTQTRLLLPGNLTGSVEALPLRAEQQGPALFALISHYRTVENRFTGPGRKAAFMKQLRPTHRRRSWAWGSVQKTKQGGCCGVCALGSLWAQHGNVTGSLSSHTA